MTRTPRPAPLAVAIALAFLSALSPLGPLARATAPAQAPAAAPVHDQVWTFTATLDGKPIGTHRFSLTGDEGAHVLVSDARFDVKVLGLAVYHYDHHATEHWQGDCLASLVARTDDGGQETAVKAEPQGDALRIDGPAGDKTAPGCVMTYAYWNPALRHQTRLLNAGTGAVDAVQVSDAGAGMVAVAGHDVAATRWRIASPQGPVDVWTDAQGRWIGLDAQVKGRRLSYRLP